VISGSDITGNADSGVSSENGVGNGGGGTSGNAGSNGHVISPFLDTQSVATGTSVGSGETASSIDLADPAVVADTVTNGAVSGNVVFASYTQAVAQSSPASTGGGVLTTGSLTAAGATNGMGLTTSGTASGTINGSGLGASRTTYGRAGGDGLGAISGAAFTNGESNQADAPFIGTGDATASFSNGSTGSFGQAAPTSPAYLPVGVRTAVSGPLTATNIGVTPKPAVVGFQVKKEP
jgi:hypothetical protein